MLTRPEPTSCPGALADDLIDLIEANPGTLRRVLDWIDRQPSPSLALARVPAPLVGRESEAWERLDALVGPPWGVIAAVAQAGCTIGDLQMAAGQSESPSQVIDAFTQVPDLFSLVSALHPADTTVEPVDPSVTESARLRGGKPAIVDAHRRLATPLSGRPTASATRYQLTHAAFHESHSDADTTLSSSLAYVARLIRVIGAPATRVVLTAADPTRNRDEILVLDRVLAEVCLVAEAEPDLAEGLIAAEYTRSREGSGTARLAAMAASSHARASGRARSHTSLVEPHRRSTRARRREWVGDRLLTRCRDQDRRRQWGRAGTADRSARCCCDSFRRASRGDVRRFPLLAGRVLPLVVDQSVELSDVTCVALSQPENVIFGHADGHVTVSSTGSNSILAGHTGSVTALAASPRDGRMITAAVDCTVRVWSREGRLACIHRGHSAPVRHLAIASGCVVSGDDTGAVHAWAPDSGRQRFSLGGHLAAVSGLVVLGLGVVSTALDGSVRWWALDQGGSPDRILRSSGPAIVAATAKWEHGRHCRNRWDCAVVVAGRGLARYRPTAGRHRAS